MLGSNMIGANLAKTIHMNPRLSLARFVGERGYWRLEVSFKAAPSESRYRSFSSGDNFDETNRLRASCD